MLDYSFLSYHVNFLILIISNHHEDPPQINKSTGKNLFCFDEFWEHMRQQKVHC